MAEAEMDGLVYLSKVFKRLSNEKKDHVLSIAQSLLEIQENSIYLTGTENTSTGGKNNVPHEDTKE